MNTQGSIPNDHSCDCTSCSTDLLSGTQEQDNHLIQAMGDSPNGPELSSNIENLVVATPKTIQLVKPWLSYGIALSFALLSEIIHQIADQLPGLTFFPLDPGAVLALVAIGLTGFGTFKKGWISILRLKLNMNALMSIAVTGAFILQYWSEAAMVMVLFSLSEKIEELSVARAGNAIRKLLDISPSKALKFQPDGTWAEMPVKLVHPGDQIRVLGGERIPIDGVVINGSSWVDQSPLTGESVPLEKLPGHQVFAGTVNLDGILTLEVTVESDQTELATIIRIMKQAQSNKAPIQRFIDSFATYYTPLVVIAALLTAIIPPLAMGLSWGDWIYRALVLLIISCPCALVISTPVTVVSGLTAGTRAGIIIKGGVHLEKAGQMSHLALDKTGTLTLGRPVVTQVEWYTHESYELYQSLAALCAQSTHPLSKAVGSYADEHLAQTTRFHVLQDGSNSQVIQSDSPHNQILEVTHIQVIPGLGVQGNLHGVLWSIGSIRFMEELGIPILSNNLLNKDNPGSSSQDNPGSQVTTDQPQAQVYVAKDSNLVAMFLATDTLKPTSVQAVWELRALGIEPVLLSGDTQETVQQVATATDITQAHGGLLPEHKVQWIVNLQNGTETKAPRDKKSWVAMAGDGINDGPSLVQSDLGIAMGSLGTGVAIESASVVLMDDDLRKIPFLIRLSRKTRQILFQNIAIALGIKTIFFILTFLGYGSMWMAVFADMGASLLVIFLGLRLLNFGRDTRFDSMQVQGFRPEV
jgi:Cd2+/Zn2+-exporting ATPase